MRYILPLILFLAALCAEAQPVREHAARASGARGTGTRGAAWAAVPTGAKFEPDSDHVYHGVGGLSDEIAAYDAAMDTDTRPYLEQLFYDLPGSGPRYANLRAALAAHRAIGRFPVLSIDLTDGTIGTDSLIAATSQFDAAIDSIAAICREFGTRMFVRPGFEFSNSWNGYHPYLYPKAFRKIVDRFRAMNAADSVAFIWCYYSDGAPNDFDAQDANGARWYPGDDYVDWFGIDVFFADEFDVSLPVSDAGGITLRGKTDRFLEMARDHNKPVIVAEASAAGVDITADSLDGDDDWFAWFDVFWTFLDSYREIKGFCYMNANWGGDWGNARIDANPLVLEYYRIEMLNLWYIHLPKKTTPPVLPAPVLRSPANGSTVAVATVSMEWNPSNGATLYDIQVSTTPGFEAPLVNDSLLPATTFDTPWPLAPGQYYWRVRARNQTAMSMWSESWWFSTKTGLPAQVILASPPPAAIIIDVQVNLQWHPGTPQVDRYWVEIADNASFTNPTIDSSLVDTSMAVGGLVDGRTYWWRVRARNGGGWGPYSAQRDFVVQLESSVDGPAQPGGATAGLGITPNPVTASATIGFTLSRRGQVWLAVYDEQGRLVRTLADGTMDAGSYSIPFNSTSLPAGFYMCTLTTAEGSFNRTLHIVR